MTHLHTAITQSLQRSAFPPCPSPSGLELPPSCCQAHRCRRLQETQQRGMPLRRFGAFEGAAPARAFQSRGQGLCLARRGGERGGGDGFQQTSVLPGCELQARRPSRGRVHRRVPPPPEHNRAAAGGAGRGARIGTAAGTREAGPQPGRPRQAPKRQPHMETPRSEQLKNKDAQAVNRCSLFR